MAKPLSVFIFFLIQKDYLNLKYLNQEYLKKRFIISY